MPLLQKILIKYHNPDLKHIDTIEKGDWIDLRAAEKINLKAGEAYKISLGVSMQLPPGYEAHVRPRSSTFKNFGLIQTNALGVVDESYCGDDDRIMMPVWATKDVDIHINDRLCQFRILKHQPALEFTETDKLSGISRGGFGSTGIN